MAGVYDYAGGSVVQGGEGLVGGGGVVYVDCEPACVDGVLDLLARAG